MLLLHYRRVSLNLTANERCMASLLTDRDNRPVFRSQCQLVFFTTTPHEALLFGNTERRSHILGRCDAGRVL